MKNKTLSHALSGAALVGLVFFTPGSKVLAEEDTRPACAMHGEMGRGGFSSVPAPCKTQSPVVIEAPPNQEPPGEKSTPSGSFCRYHGPYGSLCTRLVGNYTPRETPVLEASGEEPPELLERRRKGGWGPAITGYARNLSEAVKHDALAGLSWQQQPDGSITAVRRIHSEGAKRLRLKMKIAPEFNGELRFAPTGDPAKAVGPITRRDWEGMVDLYHAPPIDGDDMLIEIRMPDGKIPPAGAIRFIDVGHLYGFFGTENSLKNVYAPTLPCHNEVACAKTVAERVASKETAWIQHRTEGVFFL
ncbi:MAG: hypothetical protein FWD77_12140 [Betaproteobacteria bacterium]|nr:hypothetical protein [Betaproteobacteria bacterium]